MVELKQFITETLRDIVEGIQEAQAIEGVGGLIAPKGIGGHTFSPESGVYHQAQIVSTVVKFNVAVTAETADAAKGHGGIKILAFGGGIEGQVSSKESAVSHIQFPVPLVMPPNKRTWHNEGP